MYFAIGCASMCISLITATYGHHGPLSKEDKKKWEKAVRYQQLASIPLLFASSKQNKHIPALLSILGMAFFCVPLYYTALKKDNRFTSIMPTGGVLMMISWLALGFLS